MYVPKQCICSKNGFQQNKPRSVPVENIAQTKYMLELPETTACLPLCLSAGIMLGSQQDRFAGIEVLARLCELSASCLCITDSITDV